MLKVAYSLNIDLLKRLSDQLDNNLQPTKTGGWLDSDHTVQLETNDHIYIFSSHVSASGPVIAQSPIKLIIKDQSGHTVSDFNLPGGLAKLCQSTVDCKQETEGLIAYFKNQMEELTRRSNTLTEDVPDVWSFWDFVYFSTITQTTVGYGDILPNSTLIRTIVTIHLLVGTVLLVVVINLVLGSGEQRNKKPV